MKKILVLSIALIAVIALSAGGTWAYFNDVVSVDNNTIAAGTLHLNGVTGSSMSIGGDGLYKPNDTPADASLLSGPVTNAGTVAGNLTIKIANTDNTEGTLLAIETKSGDAGSATGELGTKLKVALWFDGDATHAANNSWSQFDTYLLPAGGTNNLVAWSGGDGTTIPQAAYSTLNSYTGTTTLTATGGAIFGTLKVRYYLPNNTTQFWLSKLAVTNGGAAYNINDVLTLSNGATATVTAVNGSNAITKINVTTGGVYNSGASITTTSCVPVNATNAATFTGVDQYNTDNVVQSDTSTFDVVLTLTQQ